MKRPLNNREAPFALVWGLVAASLVAPGIAKAQCRAARDCPSNRVCIDTACLFRLDGEPTADSTPRSIRPSRPTATHTFPRSTPTATITARARDPGWAYEAGITGIVGSFLTLSIGLASEFTNAPGELVPSLPLGGIATLIFGGAVPLVAAGGASARARSGLRENTFLRILGWGTYGASLTLASILIVVGISTTIPRGIITTTTLLGTSSLIIMTVDAFKARNDALALSAGRDTTHAAISKGSGFTLAPKLETGRIRGLSFGWGTRF